MADKFLGESDDLPGNNGSGDDTRTALSHAAFAPPEDNHLRDLGIATGTGLVLGGAGSAATDVAVTKLIAEPFANGVARSLLGAVEPLAGTRLGFTPSSLKLVQCINPKRAVIAALVTAAALGAGYEIYHSLNDSQT